MIALWWGIALLTALGSSVAAIVFYGRYVSDEKTSVLDSCKKSKKMLFIFASFYIIYAILQMWLMMRRKQSFLPVIQHLFMINVFFLAAAIDIKCLKIPNALMLFLLIVRTLFIIGMVVYAPKEWRNIIFQSLLGLLIGGFIILVCMLLSRGGIGAGDMKMFAVCGFFIGLSGILETMMFALILASLFSIVMLLFKKAKLKSTIPMAPFICIGAFVYSFL